MTADVTSTEGETTEYEARSIEAKPESLWCGWILCIIEWCLLSSILILHYGFYYEEDLKAAETDMMTTTWGPQLLTFCIIYFMYFTEWRKSESIQCLQHIRDVPFMTAQLERLRNAQPTIDWKIECYHMKSGGVGSPATKRPKRVVTHRAKQRYEYDECQDRSLRVEDLGLEQHSLITLKITKEYEFGDDATETHFKETKDEFLRSNKRDKKQAFYEKFKLNEDFDVHSLVESPGGRSKFVSFGWACFFSCFLCSPCYRHAGNESKSKLYPKSIECGKPYLRHCELFDDGSNVECSL